MIRRDPRRRFELENPDTRIDRVRLRRPRPPGLSGAVVAVAAFLVGAAVAGSIWGGFAAAALGLLIWGAAGIRAVPAEPNDSGSTGSAGSSEGRDRGSTAG